MTRFPCRSIRDFAKNCGVKILRPGGIAANHGRLISLACRIIEKRLILAGSQPVARLPCWCAGLFAPDGCVKILGSIEIPAHPVEHIALACEIVEGRLVLSCSQTMARDPRAR